MGDGDAGAAGEMVVAGPRGAQRLVADRARPVARRRLDGGDHGDAFQHAGHQGRRQPEIAVAALGDTASSLASTSFARWTLAVDGAMPARKASSLAEIGRAHV